VVSPLLYTYFRGKVIGAENVPTKNPFLVVCNHASYFDPPIVSCAVQRPVAYMAKAELFNIPLLSSAIRLYGAYPVKRGSSDRTAIRAALDALDKGWGVGIFLQGTRTPDGTITKPKLGAAMIAAKSQVPLLPLALRGTNEILVKNSPFPRPVPITVRIGTLIEPPIQGKRESLEAVTEKCAAEINKMHGMGR
jgi:1-acyl-sn-glycerol-3-phosphate acyltransferase